MNLPTVTVTETSHRSTSAAQGAERSADARRAARPHEVVQAAVGAISSDGATEARNVHKHEHSRAPIGRDLTPTQRQMLANVDKFGDIRGGGDTEVVVREGGTPAAEVKATPDRAREEKPAPGPDTSTSKVSDVEAPAQAGGAAKEPAKETAEPEKPAADAAKSADSDLATRYESMREHNRRLVEELERRDAAPPTMDDRLKALDEIERDMTPDPMSAIRKLVALNAGLKPDAPEVNEIMSGIYEEWTGNELKVPMEKGARALIGERRNRMLIERDKREREAARKRDEERSQTEQRQKQAQGATKWLGEQLTTKYAGKFPLLEHAQLFDNMPPEQALFAAIARGLAAGEHKREEADDVLINHYAKELESRYKPRFEKLEEYFAKKLESTFEKKFKPAPSTAPEAGTQASASTTGQAADTNQAGVRTITNASASVAPASPPAVAATQPAKDDTQPQKWRNEDERRRYFARLHFGDA